MFFCEFFSLFFSPVGQFSFFLVCLSYLTGCVCVCCEGCVCVCVCVVKGVCVCLLVYGGCYVKGMLNAMQPYYQYSCECYKALRR